MMHTPSTIAAAALAILALAGCRQEPTAKRSTPAPT
jgi:outer membrane murein-binding lipoprotein Lpp